ncbi:MAG: GH36 C-terminal domain-containing protein [Armatimonadetes bacterium]|nr:GH36 C-terminal domain-containing protein [Candidatus Hippobium faecium]
MKVCDILPKGLENDAVYKVVSLDSEDSFEIRGAKLMEKGIEVSIGNRLESRLYYFEKI